MAVNAGVIEGQVRLNLKQLRRDLQSLDTLVKTHTSQVANETERISTYLTGLQTKQGKTLTAHQKELQTARNLFIKLYNATAQTDAKTRNSLMASITVIDNVIEREKNLTEVRAKRVAKQKSEAEELKRIERANLAIAKEKERIEQQNATAQRARARLELSEEKRKQEAYKRSLLGRMETQVNNLAFLAAWKLRNVIINTVTRSIRELVKTSIEYEASLSNTQAVAQATAEGLNALDEAAQKAGMTTKFTASESAEALYELASAGFDAYESTEALNGVLLMAAATNESVASTATLVAATIRQFRLQAEEADRVANVLTASISTSQATMQKLKVSLTQAGTVASGLNIPLEQMVGLLDLMYDSGMQASRAGRAMRNVLAELSNENSRTVKKLKELGIAFEDIDLNTNSLVDAFGSLSESGLSTGQIMDAFGKVIGPQMMILIRSSRQELERYVDRISDTNRASTAAATQLDNLKGDLKLLESAWQALGITISKWWIPIARKVVQIARDVTRAINTVASDLLGLTTSTEKYKRLADDMAESIENYKKFTDLLTKSTGELTVQQKALYETEIKRARLDTLRGLKEINDAYEDQINVIGEVARIESLSTRWQDDRMSNYEKLAKAIGRYDDLSTSSARLGTQNTKFISDQLNKWESEIMSLYQSIVVSDKQISQATGAVQHIDGISKQAKRAMLDIDTMNTSAQGFTIPAFTDEEGVIRYAQTFDELLNIIKTTPGVFDMLDSTLKKNATYWEKIRVLNDAALTISTERIESERDVQDVITQTARYLNAKIIAEKDLAGFNPQMVASILKTADALSKQGDATDKTTVITAAAYEEMLNQLELTNEVREAIAKDIEKTLESAQRDIEKADSLAMLNSAYAVQIDVAQMLAASLRKEAEERYNASLEELEAKRQANDYTEAEEEQAEQLGITAEEMLKARIEQNKLNEETAVGEQLARQEAEALAEKTLRLIELTRAEEDYVRERDEAYAKSLENTDKWSSKVLNQENKRLEDYDTIIEKYGAFGISKIEENTEERIAVLQKQYDLELKALQEAVAKEDKEAQSTYASRVSKLNQEYSENLRALDEYLRLYNVRIDNNAAIELEKINAEYQTKLDKQKLYLEDGTDTQEQYDAEVAKIESEHNDKILAIQNSTLTAKTLADKQYATDKEALEKELGDKLVGEQEALDATITANAKELSEEQVALATYTAGEQAKATEEGGEAIKKAWKSTLKELEDYISNTQQLMDAFSSLVTAQTNARIAEIEREMDADIEARKKAYENQLLLNGFRLDNERETLEKSLEEARKSANEEAIIEAERALQKYEIQKAYEDDVSKLEEKAAKEKAERQYKAAMFAYRMSLAEISLNTAKAIMQIWADSSLFSWSKPVFTAIAGAAGVAQMAAAVASRPVQADYFATGGIVRGTPEGTQLIAGEGNRTEAIFNPDQMANLLMAIAQGRNVGGGGGTSFTLVLKNMYDKEVARYVIEDVVNKGVILIDGKKGIKGVAR